MSENELRSKRGFAAMSPERRREIATSGGRAAHAKGTAHEWDSDTAADAGRKGGAKISADREHMREMGRRGGVSVAADREHMAQIGRSGGAAISKNRDHMSNIGRKGGLARHRHDNDNEMPETPSAAHGTYESGGAFPNDLDLSNR